MHTCTAYGNQDCVTDGFAHRTWDQLFQPSNIDSNKGSGWWWWSHCALHSAHFDANTHGSGAHKRHTMWQTIVIWSGIKRTEITSFLPNDWYLPARSQTPANLTRSRTLLLIGCLTVKRLKLIEIIIVLFIFKFKYPVRGSSCRANRFRFGDKLTTPKSTRFAGRSTQKYNVSWFKPFFIIINAWPQYKLVDESARLHGTELEWQFWLSLVGRIVMIAGL